MTDLHPTYPNPTVAEVVCDIHFRLPDDKSWEAEFLGRFYGQISKTYPVMEPVSEVEVQVEMTPQGVHQYMASRSAKVRFKHANGLFLLHLVENNLTVNVVGKYPRWDVVLNEVVAVWKKLSTVVRPSVVTRIGLRYINRIPRDVPDQPPRAWFRACEYLSEIVLDSQPGVLYRAQTQLDKHNRLIVTMADLTEGETSPSISPFIFDIDRITEHEIGVGNAVLSRELRTLHDHVWHVFSSAKTEHLTQLLEREGP